MADLIRPAAASARYGVSVRTLARWAKRGLIGRSQLGGMTFYVASDIRDVIAAPLAARTVVPITTPRPAEPAAADWRDHPLWRGTARRAGGRP